MFPTSPLLPLTCAQKNTSWLYLCVCPQTHTHTHTHTHAHTQSHSTVCELNKSFRFSVSCFIIFFYSWHYLLCMRCKLCCNAQQCYIKLLNLRSTERIQEQWGNEVNLISGSRCYHLHTYWQSNFKGNTKLCEIKQKKRRKKKESKSNT